MPDVDAWVSAEFQTLAQVIKDYDQDLSLAYIPPEDQVDLVDKSKVFLIYDEKRKCPVMFFSSVAHPQQILQELWSRDLDKNDVIGRMDAANAAAEALKLRRDLDEREARKDFAEFVLRNTKSTWTHEGRKYDDEFRDLGPTKTVID